VCDASGGSKCDPLVGTRLNRAAAMRTRLDRSERGARPGRATSRRLIPPEILRGYQNTGILAARRYLRRQTSIAAQARWFSALA